MNEEYGFRSLVQSKPDDLASRLMYADWLEERGDPRAEYLRLEVEAARIQGRLETLRQQLDAEWLNHVSLPQLHSVLAYPNARLYLRSGRQIVLGSLSQEWIYEGLIEGVPHRQMNDEIIERAKAEAGRAPKLLLPPPRRDYMSKPGDMEQIKERSRRYMPEFLPSVRCIGTFDSNSPTSRHPNQDTSYLTVVWFQEGHALPIREPALRQLQEMDWDALAEGGSF